MNDIIASDYLVALFDILGFESRLVDLGLNCMYEKYQKLINIIDENNKKQELLKSANLYGRFWAQDGQFEVYEIKGAYASDSIIIWANRIIEGGGIRFANGSFGNPPISPNHFLNICNELICCSLEIGLPLRGAVSVGKAIIIENRNIFLGFPFVEVARLEKRQTTIGATPCKAFQLGHRGLNPYLLLPYEKHLKSFSDREQTFGAVLDWPRRWRESRDVDVRKVVKGLDSDVRFSKYYNDTIELIDFSEKKDTYWKK